MKKFEYKFEHIKDEENLFEKLNLFGQEGWEVISCNYRLLKTDISQRITEVLLKRELLNNSQTQLKSK